MAKARSNPIVYEAMASFYVGGTFVNAGNTVADGHPMLHKRKHLFRPFVPTFGVAEEAEAPEPTPEPTPDPTPEAE